MPQNAIYSYRLLMQNALKLKVLYQKVFLVKNFLALRLIVTLLLKNINELCKKGNSKLHALTRCAKFMNTEKRCAVFKAFQFRNSIIVHQCGCFILNNRINSLHEKVLRVIYQDRNSSFSELLNFINQFLFNIEI